MASREQVRNQGRLCNSIGLNIYRTGCKACTLCLGIAKVAARFWAGHMKLVHFDEWHHSGTCSSPAAATHPHPPYHVLAPSDSDARRPLRVTPFCAIAPICHGRLLLILLLASTPHRDGPQACPGRCRSLTERFRVRS